MSQKRRFSAQPKTVQRDLRRVIDAMDATSLKISQDIFEGTSEIVFDRSGQRYVFRCSKYDDALDNLRAAQLTITYLWRALEEYGVSSETHTLDQVFVQFFLGFAATLFLAWRLAWKSYDHYRFFGVTEELFMPLWPFSAIMAALAAIAALAFLANAIDGGHPGTPGTEKST